MTIRYFAEAINAAMNAEHVVPVHNFDSRLASALSVVDERPHARLLGHPKMSRYRAKFLMECVIGLRLSLSTLGSDLLVFYDKPEHVLPGVGLSRDPLHAHTMFLCAAL